MEYTQKTPNNLSKYVDDFHISVKKEFETALTNIYTSEINKYSDIIEHIVKLPFVKAIVDENIRLKEDILILHEISRKHENQLDHKQVVLEISDKPIEQAYQNMDDVVLNHGSDDEDSDDEDSDDEDSDDEDSDDEDRGGDDIDKSLCVESNLNNQPTFPKPIIEEIQTQQVEQSSHEELEEEAEEEQSADEEDDAEEEEVEQSADEEEVDEGEHVKQSDDKEEVEQSVDEEDDEEEEVEQSADDEEEEEQEVTELEIDGKTYYCDGDENGNIYEDDDGDVGNIVGELKDGEAIFH